ncbi:MAG: class I SAM-dependent methyltransferase [Oculatellaceae cyanobacterium Prado106]|jgi:ubiquinone/menaquinone biosynthesis C-methylase UbiE|nr:class I SAM-dependent methyltransferase [Oculatellaceae cyanobacterium Prado106]
MPDAARPPLYQQDPQSRFSNRADDYAKYRPSYPAAAIDAILQDLPLTESRRVADVGAGTGISSRLLGDRNLQVLAIEPNATMREAAQPHANVEYRASSAEQTGLADASVQLVTCCQAFHWFVPEPTLREFHRILAANGRVALMWNDRDLTDPFTQEHDQLIQKASERHIYDNPSRKSAQSLATSPLFCHYREQRFTWKRPHTAESLIGLALSSSYIPKSGAAHDQLLVDLQGLYDRWVERSTEGGVAIAYQTLLYIAEKT